ncbi:MAG TPA: tetratricopeptide repeat protein [Stellaceae bacterium]|nr:tetratricopeptide repeat protein [Stellaceae bacterium]
MNAGAPSGHGAGQLAELNERALAAHRAGRSLEALQIFDTLLDAAPGIAVLHSNRATVLADLGRDAEALPAFTRAIEIDHHHLEARLGLGALLRRRGAVTEALGCYRIAAERAPERLDAHLAIYELAQIVGDRATALAHQRRALAIRRLFSEDAVAPPARKRVLAVKMPGDWQANLPIEYVLDRTTTAIHTYFVDLVELRAPTTALPACDIIFNTIAESDEAAPILAALPAFARRLGLPLINDPQRVLAVARGRFPSLLATIPRCRAPQALRFARAELTPERIAAAGIAPPFLLRPQASHGGNDLVRIEAWDAIAPYLAGLAETEFYATPFVDYAGADGYFRKYRVIFVDGEPFPYHLAISPGWMVHYYSSGMRENEWMRAEEAAFLGDLGSVFDAGLQDALRRLAAAVGLDYFGLDCSVTREGELLVFEIETGMIVHDLDPVELYPYKPAAFRRIQSALDALILRRIAAAKAA